MSNDFIQVQEAFIQHIRQPDSNPAPEGIEDRRMKIYRELFFNNVTGFLSNGFPVLKSLYSEENWQVLCRSFFAQHDCRSPYFVDISKEFVEFLSNEYQMTESDPVFMLELAHYEWVELAVSVDKSDVIEATEGKVSNSTVSLNPTANILSYQYPVHQISVDYQPDAEEEQPTYLVVYRDLDDEVQFVAINVMTAHLLNLIEQQPAIALNELVEQMSKALPQLEESQLRNGVKQILTQMTEKTVLIGGI